MQVGYKQHSNKMHQVSTGQHKERGSHLEGRQHIVAALQLGEVHVQGAAVDGEGAGPRPDPDARDTRLAPSSCIRAAQMVNAAHPPRRILLLQRLLYLSPLLPPLLPRVLHKCSQANQQSAFCSLQIILNVAHFSRVGLSTNGHSPLLEGPVSCCEPMFCGNERATV